MSLTKLEKETIILFNELEDTAEVETFNARLLRQLRKVADRSDVICKVDKKDYGLYTVPKKMIKIHAPQKKRILTEEERAKMDVILEQGRKLRWTPPQKIHSEVE